MVPNLTLKTYILSPILISPGFNVAMLEVT